MKSHQCSALRTHSIALVHQGGQREETGKHKVTRCWPVIRAGLTQNRRERESEKRKEIGGHEAHNREIKQFEEQKDNVEERKKKLKERKEGKKNMLKWLETGRRRIYFQCVVELQTDWEALHWPNFSLHLLSVCPHWPSSLDPTLIWFFSSPATFSYVLWLLKFHIS